MPRVKIRIPVKVPYGLPNTMSIWFRNTSNNEINYTDRMFSWKITKRQNNLWFAEFKLGDIDGTDSYVKEKSTVKFFSENNLVFKGIIQKVGYESLYFCVIQVKGVASELEKIIDDQDWSSGETTANILTTLVPATASISLASDNDDYGTVSIRNENDSNLRVISKMTDMVEYYWWESYGSYPYNTDSLNFKSSQGSTNTYTFNDSGSSINCNQVKRDRDFDNQANYIVLRGYGDGANQLESVNYHATDNRSTLASALTASATTVILADASDFGSSGNVWVGGEKITYAGKSGNNLTGCTRAVASTGNVAQLDGWVDNTSGYAHEAGIEVWDAQYTTASSESGSSIDTYGTLKKTFTDTSIVSQNALDRATQTMLAKRRSPIDVITVFASEMITILNAVDIGDTVTINADDTLDTDSGSTFTVKGMIFGFDEEKGEFCIVECSDKKLEFIDSIKTSMEETKNQSIYMQGATNIYALSEKENTEYSADESKSLNMRFYIPAEAIAINKVLLKFTTQKFRAYTSSSQTSAGGSEAAKTSAGGSEASKTSEASSSSVITDDYTQTKSDAWVDGTWYTVNSQAISNDTFSYHVFWDGSVASDAGLQSAYYYFRIYDGTDYYPSETGMIGIIHQNDSTGSGGWEQIQSWAHAPGNFNGKTVSFQMKLLDDAASGKFIVSTEGFAFSSHTHDINLSTHTHNVNLSTHTHDITMGFGIYEEAFPSDNPTITVEVGAEESETEVTGSPFTPTDGGTFSADITDEVKAVGAGNWCNIKFIPDNDGHDAKIRIESNAYIQIFIKSE